MGEHFRRSMVQIAMVETHATNEQMIGSNIENFKHSVDSNVGGCRLMS